MKPIIIILTCLFFTNTVLVGDQYGENASFFYQIREDTAEVVLQYSHFWDSDINDWAAPFGLNQKSYSQAQELLESLNQSFLEDNWANTSRTTYEYNNDGFLYDETRQNWSAEGFWSANSRIEYLYNILGYMSSRLDQSWDNSSWLNERLKEYVYSEDNFLSEEMLKEWDASNWTIEDRHTWVNSGSGLPLKMISEAWLGEEWVPDYEVNYSYDSLNNNTDRTTLNYADDFLANSSKAMFFYNGHQVTEIISQYGVDDTLWVNSFRSTYTYSDDNLRLSATQQYWSDDQWLNYTKYFYFYDDEDRLLNRVKMNWNNGSWINERILRYEYWTTSSLFNSHIKFSGPHISNAYPNPFNPSTTIEYDLPQQSVVSLVIFDVTGREVQTLVSTSQEPGNHKINWNGSNGDGTQVAGGMYFARLLVGEYSNVVKMVYLR